jgi:3-phosphoshikimate 1-carboxyvinyltransferase
VSSPPNPRVLAISGGIPALAGEFRPPADKSISLRALLVAAIADGESRLEDVLVAADVTAARGALARLGVAIECEGRVTRVRGAGWPGILQGEPVAIDVGESGTAARLLLGMLAATERDIEIRGGGSLLARPMLRVVAPLREMGANIESTAKNADRLPLRVRPAGGLRPGRHRLTVPSAQVKSALLLAGAATVGVTTVHEPIVTRDHTERLLATCGVAVERRRLGAGQEVSVHGRATPRPLDHSIPADASSVLYPGVLALCTPGSAILAREVLVNPTRFGAVEVLRRMGARIEALDSGGRAGEPIATLRFESSDLVGVEVGAEEIPSLIDDVPVLAVAAALARRGETRFRAVGELRVKESDRIATTLALLRGFGCSAHSDGDDLVVPGGCSLRPGRIEAAGDHRIALAALIAALTIPGTSHIVGFDAVEKSYPGILSDLACLGVDQRRSNGHPST